MSVYIQTTNNNVVVTQLYRLILMGSERTARAHLDKLMEVLGQDGLLQTVRDNLAGFVSDGISACPLFATWAKLYVVSFCGHTKIM